VSLAPAFRPGSTVSLSRRARSRIGSKTADPSGFAHQSDDRYVPFLRHPDLPISRYVLPGQGAIGARTQAAAAGPVALRQECSR
jgi:hypothetical protein